MCAATPTDWVRRGNAAFDRGDLAEALALYHRAETEALDPGLVAFNLAATHYELGQFAEAEACYRRALEDAVGPRRVRAIYGLGNALVRTGQQLHGRPAVQRLLAAKQSYEACLALETLLEESEREACRDTFADARFNLGLVDPLLEKKRAEAAREPAAPDGGEPKRPDEKAPGSGEDPPGGETDTSPAGARGKPGPGSEDPMSGAAGAEAPRGTDQLRPGKGNLPPLLDDRDAPTLDPERALEHLRNQLDRIRRERARHGGDSAEKPTRARDW